MSKNGISFACSNSMVNLMLLTVTAVEVHQKFSGGAFTDKHGESVINISMPKCRVNFIIHFSSKSHIKMLAKTWPKGEPMATPSICLHTYLNLVVILTIEDKVAFLCGKL